MGSATLFLIIATAVVAMALPRDLSQNLIESHIKSFDEHREALRILKDIIDKMNNDIAFVQRRSVCYIGGGMGHNCEYGEALDSAYAARHLLAADNPGKRAGSGPRY